MRHVSSEQLGLVCFRDGEAVQLHTCRNLCTLTYFTSENLDRLQRTFSRHVSKTHREWGTNEKPANGQSFNYFPGPGRGAYRLQLGCCTERPTGFHRRNIRGCLTTLLTGFAASCATVNVGLRQYYFPHVRMLFPVSGFNVTCLNHCCIKRKFKHKIKYNLLNTKTRHD